MIKNNISIVMTATITPNSTFVEVNDINERRNDYIRCIKYYSQYGDVFFLENSAYDIYSDYEMMDLFNNTNIHLIKFSPSQYYDKGKGFQEFEMLDNWIKSASDLPKSFIKVTGRYIIEDFNKLIDEVRQAKDGANNLIIDVNKQKQVAYTHLFYINTDYYKKHIFGIYNKCDDNAGLWIEKVLFALLKDLRFRGYIIFQRCYQVMGRSGSTGKKYIHRNKIKLSIVNFFRKINYIINPQNVFLE